MLCHADSRLEQNGRCAFILREKGVRTGERMRPGDGDGGKGEGRTGKVKPCCEAGTRSGASNSLPSKAGGDEKKWTELIYNNQNWTRVKTKRHIKYLAR